MKKRIIPIFTYKNNILVKSIKYTNYRNVNSIIPMIKLFNKRNIDEIIFLNLEDNINFNFLETFVNEIDYPITYGGGINDIDTMKKIFNIGFDKICLNSLVYNNLPVVIKAKEIFGKQSITINIDVKKNLIDNNYYCYYNNGKYDTNIKLEDHINNIIKNDIAGEIIISNIDNDGTFNGFDINLYKLTEKYKIRILANCGGNYDEKNIIDTIDIYNIEGICFSSLFLFKQYTPNDIKEILFKNNKKCINYFSNKNQVISSSGNLGSL
jgi:cyclase